MIISEKDQGRVLHHLDKARNVLRLAKKGDERNSKSKKDNIIEQINAVAHNIQALNTRPK